MKYLNRIIADILFVVHFCIVLIALFGWLFPSIWYFYMTLLLVALISDWLLGYCILSKWEFDFRKKNNPTLYYNYSWTTFYTYKLIESLVSKNFIERMAIFFTIASLFLNIYLHYFLK